MDQASLFSRAKAERVGTVSNGLLYLFLAFQILDQTILPFLVITFLFTSAKRLPTLVNVCFTWILAGIISSLLLYAGKHVGPEPPKMLCVTQAALIYAVPPMTSVSALTLMFQTHRSIRRLKDKSKSDKTLIYALVIIPYIVFFGFATTGAFIATQQPETVSRARRFFFCSFKTRIFSNVVAVFTALMLLVTQGFVVMIIIVIIRNWRALRQSGSLDIQTLSRVVVFGLYVVLAFVLSLISFISPRTPIPDLFTASVGTVLTLSLATQPDIYRVWFRCPRPTPPNAISKPIQVDIEKLSDAAWDNDSPVGNMFEDNTAVMTAKPKREAVQSN